MDDVLERPLALGGPGFAGALALVAVLDDARADAYLAGLAAFFLIAFLGALRARLRAAEGETAPLSATAVIGGSVAAAGYAFLAAGYASVARDGLAESSVELAEFAVFVSFPQAAVLAAAATVIARTDVVARALGIAGHALVPLQLGAPLVLLSSGSDDFGIALALVPFCAWVAAAGALLARTGRSARVRRDPGVDD